MAGIKKGTLVTQVVAPIRGTVTKTRHNEETESLEHLVSYTGADGESHERWFAASELTADAEQPKAEGDAA